MTKVGDLSEGEILDRIVPLLPIGDQTLLGPGDDCAVVKAPGGSFVVTTDILVEDHHFLTSWSSASQIGARAVAQNLSDVAAMGAVPTSLVVSLVLPAHTEIDWVIDLAAGMAAEARKGGAGIVGGDLTTGDKVVIAVTAHGYCTSAPVTRSGARPGDTVAIVGTLGRSGAGLAALQSGRFAPSFQGDQVPHEFAEAVSAYRVPKPPYSSGPLAAQRGATAMMDLSDGLTVDAERLAKASDVTIDLNSEALRRDADVLADAGRILGVDPMQWVLFGGEDHSFLATFPPHVLVSEPFRIIGSVGFPRGDDPRNPVRLDGRRIHGGWDHFRQ